LIRRRTRSSRPVDFKSAPIDPDFKSKLQKTGTHHNHDVCPVNVFEWALNPGQSGSGKDRVIDLEKDKELF
jgi:hypothetical protein